jgi:hypothetical protein
MELLFVGFCALAFFSAIGAMIGSPRGHWAPGLLLGMMFGPLGWLIVAILPRTAMAQARHNVRVRIAEGQVAIEAKAARSLDAAKPQRSASLDNRSMAEAAWEREQRKAQ